MNKQVTKIAKYLDGIYAGTEEEELNDAGYTKGRLLNAGIVVAYPYSDDCVELYGAVNHIIEVRLREEDCLTNEYARIYFDKGGQSDSETRYYVDAIWDDDIGFELESSDALPGVKFSIQDYDGELSGYGLVFELPKGEAKEVGPVSDFAATRQAESPGNDIDIWHDCAKELPESDVWVLIVSQRRLQYSLAYRDSDGTWWEVDSRVKKCVTQNEPKQWCHIPNFKRVQNGCKKEDA